MTFDDALDRIRTAYADGRAGRDLTGTIYPSQAHDHYSTGLVLPSKWQTAAYRLGELHRERIS